MRIKLMLKGVATYIPGVATYRARGTGGTNSARYCYSVWLRHFVMAHRNGLCQQAPNTLLELGPGDSLGIGLAALLTGAEKYFGLDVVEHASIERNLAVFDELVALFRKKEPIPGEREFPRVRPLLDSYEFPSQILLKNDLDRLLAQGRLEAIKHSILKMQEQGSMVSYVTGVLGQQTIPQHSVDMVFSQAVLEYVEPLLDTYCLMNTWLRPGGFISHQIDFSCHGLAKDWDGHWAYSDLIWKLIRGKRVWFINRAPYSVHLRMIEQAGFRVHSELRVKATAARSEIRLAPRFANLSQDDRTTRGVFVQATKRN